MYVFLCVYVFYDCLMDPVVWLPLNDYGDDDDDSITL